jgi:hypothetical protein
VEGKFARILKAGDVATSNNLSPPKAINALGALGLLPFSAPSFRVCEVEMTPQTQGHGEKLTRKQGLAIIAILSAPTLASAAKRAGVSVRTVKNWLLLPDFRAELRQARQRVFEDSLTRLQGGCSSAVDALCRATRSGKPSIAVKASIALLQIGLKVSEHLDLEARLAELEAGRNRAPDTEDEETNDVAKSHQTAGEAGTASGVDLQERPRD